MVCLVSLHDLALKVPLQRPSLAVEALLSTGGLKQVLLARCIGLFGLPPLYHNVGDRDLAELGVEEVTLWWRPLRW